MIRIATHSGNFHADDIGAVTSLKLLHKGEDVEVVRTRDETVIDSADYVVDVGGEYDPQRNRFDHHQEGYNAARDNGVPYAAFGLVWKHYGEEIAGSKEVARLIDERVVQPIDALDNGTQITEPVQEGVDEFTLHDVIAAFRPTWKEEEGKGYETFMMLVRAAENILARQIKVSGDWVEGSQYTREAYERADDKQIIILDKRYPWVDVLVDYPEPIYVVYPGRVKGYWRVKTVKKDLKTFENRKDLPKEWASKRDEELQEVTGVDTAVFCHKNRFLAVAENKEGALRLAQMALED